MIEFMEDDRVFLNYGPIQMILDISHKNSKANDIAREVAEEIKQEFLALQNDYEILKTTDIQDLKKLSDDKSFSIVAKKMITAVRSTGLKEMTPLSAVAGSFSELAVELAMEKGAHKAIVNNGGDIALMSKFDEVVNVGLPLSDCDDNKILIPVNANKGIFGICTSGLGGRSFTKGIADAVVVVSSSPPTADVCATYIANETNVEDENISRCKAKELDSGTDIPEELVTIEVGELDKKKVYRALLNGLNQAENLVADKLIQGAVLSVKNEITMFPENLAKLT
ncbi:UPF0280 family protein [Natranaerobius thermophilus]|uniref:ApbE family lipoprotein n=1 Tax=Natranaerobius thermophilus (strain ATCC BAA-1301 / DSM 18059 / JW/NM-WN-LF) TaxID=457570 RepID=B2A7K4_NATTJ|nr:UPF0280 family protein [Natranaerobius thermophilus]ACB85713.1 conserved hypothetical protein [Natranaerobius thermophilus JW/NM-WN-LF]